jgi:hypothetical protein
MVSHRSSWLAIPFAALALVAPPRSAFAAGAPCTEETFGMPCDPGDGNACAGVCEPDFTKTGAPMSCLSVDAATLGRLELASLDGIDCAPSGAPGSDCAHVCSAGACVAKSAPQGAACLPAGDTDGGLPGLPVTVCTGACDGNGACAARTDTFCNKYGRGELDVCLYTACNTAQNVGYCRQFASPSGVACSTGDSCVTGEICGGAGLCGGGTRTPGCVESAVDASLGAQGDGGETSHAADASASGPSTGGSPGCSVGGVGAHTSRATAAIGMLAALLAAASRVRRTRARVSIRV